MIEENMTFEEALKQLEELVAKVENGELSLDESIASFKKGSELVAFCQKKIEEYEKVIGSGS